MTLLDVPLVARRPLARPGRGGRSQWHDSSMQGQRRIGRYAAACVGNPPAPGTVGWLSNHHGRAASGGAGGRAWPRFSTGAAPAEKQPDMRWQTWPWPRRRQGCTQACRRVAVAGAVPVATAMAVARTRHAGSCRGIRATAPAGMPAGCLARVPADAPLPITRRYVDCKRSPSRPGKAGRCAVAVEVRPPVGASWWGGRWPCDGLRGGQAWPGCPAAS